MCFVEPPQLSFTPVQSVSPTTGVLTNKLVPAFQPIHPAQKSTQAPARQLTHAATPRPGGEMLVPSSQHARMGHHASVLMSAGSQDGPCTKEERQNAGNIEI